MPALLKCEKCPACGGYHDFYLPDNDLFSMSGTYEYICPQNQQVGHIRPVTANTIALNCPSGAVIAKRVDVP